MEITNIQETLSVLGKISSEYEEDSEEYKAIQLASNALIYIFKSHVDDKFQRLLNDFDSPLTEKQKQHLRSMGLLDEE